MAVTDACKLSFLISSLFYMPLIASRQEQTCLTNANQMCQLLSKSHDVCCDAICLSTNGGAIKLSKTATAWQIGVRAQLLSSIMLL
jgi:hypothetical protein